jgi:hypothetical protein
MRAASEVYKARPWPELGVVKLYGALGSRTVDLQTCPNLSGARANQMQVAGVDRECARIAQSLGNAQTSAKIT